MESVQRKLPESTSLWAMAAAATVYILLHLLVVAALFTFGQRAGGYPLDPLAIIVYGLVAAGGTVWAVRRATRDRGQGGHDRLLPLLALAIFLAVSLAGVFVGTQSLHGEPLARFGLHLTYPPYLDDDGQFAWVNVALAFGVVLLALAAGWRGLLLAGMSAQGLALLLSPSLLAAGLLHLPESLIYGLYPRGKVLIALPVLYAAGAIILGWRPLPSRLLVLLVAIGALLAALLALGNLVGAALWVAVPALPFLPRQLAPWAARGAPPSRMAAAGASLALLVLVATLSWHYLGPEATYGDSYLPAEGKTMGWIGKTVPEGAYGAAGDALLGLKLAFPWLLGAAAIAWLGAVGRIGWRIGIRGAARRLGLPGGLMTLGLGMVYQGPFTLFSVGPGSVWLPLRGMAASLPIALGERGLGLLVDLGYPLLGLLLIGLAVALRGSSGQSQAWLTFAATILALVSAVILSAGLLAGTMLALRSLDQLTLPEYRLATQVQLALGLPLNVAFVLIGWTVFIEGLWKLRTRDATRLSRSALTRASAFAAAVAVAGALAFWHFTALPVAETSPADGATNVPTNAPIVVRLKPGPRNWGPGIRAVYAESGAYVRGTTGGFGFDRGQIVFTPEGGWRPNTVVDVEICCGPNTRGYRFSFATAAGPSPEVTAPSSPGPKPTPGRPAAAPGSGS